jgi:hypothetical protein
MYPPNVTLTTRNSWTLQERRLASWHEQREQRFADFSDDELAGAARVIGRVTDIYDALAAPRDAGQLNRLAAVAQRSSPEPAQEP